MTHHRRSRFYNHTTDEFIANRVNESSADGIALAAIVDTGRDDFEMDGDELIDFVRRCVTAMLEHSAKPVIGGGGTRSQWIEQPRYGSSTQQIVDNVIAEWLANGDPDHGGLWFAKPHLF